MTQRERILAILVGGILAVVVLWWGFGKYRSALDTRTGQLERLETERFGLEEQVMQGHLAERQRAEYLIRSLPGELERARSDYQQWLLTSGRENNLDGLDVDPITDASNELYHRIGFRVSGKCRMPDLIGWLHEFYAKDYLHRIRELDFRKLKNEDALAVEMIIDAMAMTDAPVDADPPSDHSWRVDPELSAYREPILNRNFFEPPNGAPRFVGNARIDAVVGRDSPNQLAFRDPEGDRLRFEFAEQPPEGVQLDEASGTLRVRSDETQEFRVLVKVTDNGYPQRSTEQELLVRVVEPAKEPDPAPEPLKFDDATQTVLTGLVHGRDDWTAWMHVRTRDKTLKLRVNDEFEIGTLRGKVIEVTPKFVVLEVDQRRFMLKPNGILKEAADRSLED